MGWFLSSKPKQKKVSYRPKATVAKPWDPQRTLVGLKILSIIVLSLGFAVGWWELESGLVRYVGEHGGMQIRPDHVELVGVPSWMSPDIKRDLQLLASAQINSNPLDQQGLQLAVTAISEDPWVAKVRRVRRMAGGRLQVEAIYRTPVAWVECRDGLRMVDITGVVLPGVYTRFQAAGIPLLKIHGVSSSPPLPGRRWVFAEADWQACDLHAGLSLIGMLAGEPYLKQLDTIDVGGRDARNRIRLSVWTHQGGTIRWGLPPGQEQTVEPPAATKRAWLAQVNRDAGAVDVGGRVVDLFGPAVFIHFPVDSDNAGRNGYTLAQ